MTCRPIIIISTIFASAMNNGNLTYTSHPMLRMSVATMELCWMTTWAVYTCRMITPSPFPIAMMAAVFMASAALAQSIEKTASKRWHRFAVQIVAYASAVTMMWWISRHYWPIDFTRGWQASLRMGIFATRPEADAQWPAIIFLALWTMVFWWAGMAWSRREHTHQIVCKRFDLGASLLFLLFMLRFILSERFDIRIDTPPSFGLLASFFISGLFAIGWAKNLSNRPKGHPKSYRRAGMLPVFVIVIVLFGIVSIPLSISPNEGAAQFVFSTVKQVSRPLTLWLAKMLIFFFSSSANSSHRVGDSIDQTPTVSPPVESIVSEHHAFMHLTVLLYGAMILLFTIFAVGMVFRWLNAGGTIRGGPHIFEGVKAWIIIVFRHAASFIVRLIPETHRDFGTADAYAALVRWGKRSGVACRSNETPREYAYRLAERFPQMRDMVTSIVEQYNRSTYGGCHPDDVIRSRLQTAIKRLHSPLFWPVRIRSWAMGG